MSKRGQKVPSNEKVNDTPEAVDNAGNSANDAEAAKATSYTKVGSEDEEQNDDATNLNIIKNDQEDYFKLTNDVEIKHNNKQLDKSLLLKFLNFCLEASAAGDMVSDIIVIVQLLEEHPAWVTYTLLTMISPFFISYTPLINFQLKGYLSKKEQNNGKLGVFDTIMSVVSLTPLVTITLVLMDFLYIIQSIVITPIMWVLKKLFCCKKKDGDSVDFNEWIEEEVYKRTFSMNREEIVGFRRLRTISQLMFETIP